MTRDLRRASSGQDVHHYLGMFDFWHLAPTMMGFMGIVQTLAGASSTRSWLVDGELIEELGISVDFLTHLRTDVSN